MKYGKDLMRRARRILDDIRDGLADHSVAAVNWALRITGDV